MTPARDDEHLPLSRTPPVAEDVRREIDFHLRERAAELERQGVPPDRARAMAKESFGDSGAVEAECRTIEQRRRVSRKRSDKLGAMLQDARVALRMLAKSPGFTIAAIITLALGIGATTAVFSIVNRILLRPLPYAHADRLVTFVERHPNSGWGNVAWATFLDLQAQSRSFDAMAEYGSGTTTVLTASGPMRVRAGWVSSGFFKVFPTHAVMGRLPDSTDHRLGATPVAVVSYAFWRDVLGAPASLANIHIKLSSEHSVVGVLPPDFDFPAGNQIWRPMEMLEQSMYRTSHNWPSAGLLKAGITPTAAQRELDGILARLGPIHYPDWDAVGSTVTSLQESITGTVKTPLYLLLGAAGILLLAACTNLASAMLARGTGRGAEFALRSALGATRLRLMRQLLTESALLAVLGCIAGLLLAMALLRVFAPLAPTALRMDQVHVDGWVQAFALIVAVATTVLFGLFPALRLSETNTTLALREGGGGGSGGTAGARRMRSWSVLVGAEVALAVMLLAGSTLLIKSFSNVIAKDLGFDPGSALAVSVDLPAVNYGDSSATIVAFHERALAKLRALPGVDAAGFVNVLPLEGSNPNGSMRVEGKPLNPRGPFTGFSIYRVVSRGYFAAIGTKLVLGRGFNDGDALSGPAVTIVSESFAKSEWPNESPLGKRVMVAGMDGLVEPWATVIGVVADTRTNSPTSAFSPTYFFDYRQRPLFRSRSVSYVVRTRRSLAALSPAIRDAIASVDKQVPIAVRPLDDVVARAVAARRFTMLMLGTFAAIALVLAIVGIYGVVSYSVAQRTREIGVRRALGATPGEVHRLILRSSMSAVVPGLLIGAGLALLDAMALRTLLYGVSPFDATSLLLAVGALGVAALAASFLPAFRATRVDPMVAMRAD